MKMKKLALAALATTGFFCGLTAEAATLTLINNDSAGVGFNDATAASPVGGNAGTTIGQQRLIAFQRALDLWGTAVSSSVPISVRGSFAPLTCSPSSAVLGSAGATEVFRDFGGAPLAGHWYGKSLANALIGFDLDPPTPDVNARFNGNLGQTGCLTGTFFYYGLDNHPPAGTIDFLNVFMHELAHGLGFQNFINVSTGALLAGFPDAYTAKTRDIKTGQEWDAMTDAQRQASVINYSNVVWTGSSVNANATKVLGPREILRFSGALKTDTDFGSASFGPAVTKANFPLTSIALVNDGAGASTSDGCEAIVNNVVGKVALIDRGSCGFVVKAKNAQNAGAIAVIIANNTGGPGPLGLGGADPTITIPSVGISLPDGNAIKAALGSGVQAKFFSIFTQTAGSNGGLVRLYAPSVVIPGSSISHFDIVATPNLLMEPAINRDLRAARNLDLTPALLKDIGWTLESLKIAACDTGVSNANSDGELLSTFVSDCSATSSNPRQCVRDGAIAREKAGTLTTDQRRTINVCAGGLPNTATP